MRAPLSTEVTLEEAMRNRSFDLWVHEQDLRTALGRPGNLDSPGAYVARDVLLSRLPKVVAKDAGAPRIRRSSSTYTALSNSCARSASTCRAAASIDGAPSLGPAATLTLDWETYFRLACGRVTPEAVADRLKTEGDPELTAAILRNFTVTMRS